jgi:hypothetical protein
VALNNDLTELWSRHDHDDVRLSCEYVKGMSDNTFVAMQLASDTYCPIQRMGVLGYPTDQYYGKYPKLKTEIPVLVLHGKQTIDWIKKKLLFPEFEGDMDSALPLPIARHFYKQYSVFNSNVTLIEMPRTGHTAIG